MERQFDCYTSSSRSSRKCYLIVIWKEGIPFTSLARSVRQRSSFSRASSWALSRPRSPDGEGKTPMHLLCQAAGWQGEWDIRTSYRAEITIFQIFLKLFHSNCYSLCLQDCGGLTPLEYALRAEHQGIFIEKVIEYQKRADTRRL